VTVTDLARRREAQTDDPGEPSRWRPARAGILNVWRYYDEVFEFHRGRLLLRGPNGSGKSKALEVLLPFLFDASLRANRLSTFGTTDRTMHWNLMGEGATGVTRVGYVWLEFETVGPDPTWLTCGARLQASTHSTDVQPAFFTTDLRVGVPGGLQLVNEAGQPLTRSVLEAALSGHGTVHPSATEYRSVLRQALFPGMGDQRYDALITALLQLRTPKLSQRLDPGLLSTLLSRALPPLDHDDLQELAEGFERLDRQREELLRLDALVAAAEAVHIRARTYARRLLRSAAASLIAATTAMDRLTRVARESDEQYEQARADRETTQRDLETLTAQLRQGRERIEGITASESYQQGQHLDELRRHARAARSRSDTARHRAARSAGIARPAEEAAAEAERRAAAGAADADEARRALATSADRAALTAVVPPPGPDVDVHAAQRVARAALDARTTQVSEVRSALRRHSEAVRERDTAEADRSRAEDDLERARRLDAEAAAALEGALEEHGTELATWAVACTELRLDPREVADAVGSETAVLELVQAARSDAADALAARGLHLEGVRREHEATRVELAAELTERRNRVDLPPPPPRTRTSDRTGLAGAPLWQLTSFHTGVGAETQAGIEAALEGAGLLDAWITQDGGVIDVDGHDVFLGADAVPATDATSLRTVMAAEDAAAVPREVVDRILDSIMVGDTLPSGGEMAVGADGTWRVAALTGSWSKAEAAHIGSAARERARLRRIAELEARLAEVLAALNLVTTDLAGVAERRRTLDAEVRARPRGEAVTTARRQCDATAARVAAQQGRLDGCRERLTRAEATIGRALRILTEAAAERGLPANEAGLERLDAALDRVRDDVQNWVQAHRSAVASAEVAVTRRQHSDDVAEAAAAALAEAEDAEAAALGEEARLEAVQSVIGAAYEQVLGELDRVRRDLDTYRAEERDLRGRLSDLDRRIGGLEVSRTRDAEERDRAIEVRDEAGRRLRSFAGGHVVEDAGIELRLGDTDRVKATLESARQIATAWPTVPHEQKNVVDAQNRLLETLHEQRDVLAARADVELVEEGETHVLSASLGGVRTSAGGLLQAVRAERARGSEDITTAEHELFDTTLTGDTRRQLAARIRQAGELVDAMNVRLERVRTASNVAVTLSWQVDPSLPPGTRAARELLLRDPVTLSDDDRRALHVFFRERVEEARAANTSASWEEQLADVFDYTAWHHFVVKLDKGSGWEVLSKKLHGALSGGEKAIALHLPLFAAVAAHYAAVPTAPRLILLDEVFVGVDTVNRGQVFGLLAALDLDLVLTSDHEWCTYRELDGIAVHVLLSGAEDGDDAVTTARFTWDGRQLTADDGEAEP
jgi:uncharacterized protein (TIGR02680 family)